MKLLLRFESPVMLKGGSNPSMHGNGSCSRRRAVPIGGFLNELFLSVHLPNAYNIQALMHNSTILGRIRKFGQIYRFRDTDRTQPRLCVEPYSGAIWYHSGTKFFLRILIDFIGAIFLLYADIFRLSNVALFTCSSVIMKTRL